MRRLLFSLVALTSCTKAGAPQESPPPTATEPALAPIATRPPPAQATAKVELTSVTLADDCGGTAPSQGPAVPAPAPKASSQQQGAAGVAPSMSRAKRRCEQTSMQLSVVAPAATTIGVKSVELFDQAGKSLGMLAASKPTRWDEAASMYAAWDEKLAAGATSNVSYVLEQPKWDAIPDRWNTTFTLKAVVSVDGVDATTQKTVVLSAPTSLPPNVKT